MRTLAAFINENVNNALVIDAAVKGGMPPAAIKQPHGPLRMRYEPNTKELFITAADYRKFFTGKVDDLEGAPREFAATLDNIAACAGLAGSQRDKTKAYFAHTN